MKKHLQKIRILLEALPYIKRFYGKTVVIKYGGSAMIEDSLKRSFAQDMVLLKYVGINPVVVHGGGPQIAGLLHRLGKETRFIKGIRVTDTETMDVVEMVLGGKVNKEIVGLVNHYGGKAVGVSGKDAHFIKARPIKMKGEELGLAGDVADIDPSIIRSLEDSDFIPVVAPIGGDDKGQSYNINADIVAGRLASALRAEKLILLTDVEGVLDEDKKLVPSLSLAAARSLIRRKIAKEGMVPKLRCCMEAVAKGVNSAHIIDGRVEHAVLLEVFTDAGVGTVIRLRKE